MIKYSGYSCREHQPAYITRRIYTKRKAVGIHRSILARESWLLMLTAAAVAPVRHRQRRINYPAFKLKLHIYLEL